MSYGLQNAVSISEEMGNFFRINFFICAATATLLSSCLPIETQAPTKAGGNVFGISPKSVLVTWNASSTADSYELVDQNSTRAAILSKANEAQISDLAQQPFDYVYTVFGRRGTNVRELNSLYVAKFRPWTDFSDVTISAETSSLTNRFGKITWTYEPWKTSDLTASTNAQNNTRIECGFSSNLQLASPFEDPSVKIISVKAVSQTAPSVEYSIDDLPTYSKQLVQCRAKYIDGYTSLSKNKLVINPIVNLNLDSCLDAEIGSQYQCTLASSVPLKGDKLDTAIDVANPAPHYTFELDTGFSTCSWVNQETDNIPGLGDVKLNLFKSAAELPPSELSGDTGSCEIKIDISTTANHPVGQVIQLDPVRVPVTIRAEQAYKLFPSFAVRGFVGSVDFKQTIVGPPESSSRVQETPIIVGDVISDFGFGNSFFAGANEPFLPTSTKRNYGFYSESQGFVSKFSGANKVKGSLVIPRVSITNTSFKSQIGLGSGDPLYLDDFVGNMYTRVSNSTSYQAFENHFSKRSSAVESITFKMLPSNHVNTVLSGQTYRTVSQDGAFKFFDSRTDTSAAFAPPPFTSAQSNPFITNRFLNVGSNLPTDVTGFTAGTHSPKFLICIGDVYLGAPLLLVGDTFVQTPLDITQDKMGAVDIYTNSQGCRIYSNSTIFVQGLIRTFDIETLSQTDLPVQLSSARGIALGGGINFGDDLNKIFTIEPGSDQGTTVEYVRDDSNTTGILGINNDSFLIGSAPQGSYQNAMANDAGIITSLSRISDFIHEDTEFSFKDNGLASAPLVLHAPVVLWNYNTKFKGSLISEIALFPRALNFEAYMPRDTLLLPRLTGSLKPLTVVESQ